MKNKREVVSESDGSEDERPVNPVQNPLEKFMQDHPQFRPIKIPDKFSDDDEFSLLRIPKDVDPSILLNQHIELNGVTKLKINSIRYKIKPEADQPEPVLLLGKRAKVVSPLSLLTMQVKTIGKSKTDMYINDVLEPEMQGDLTARHPFFGSNYEKQIILAEDTQKRLADLIDGVGRRKKKKKQKKEKQTNELTVDGFEQSVPDQELTDSWPRKKKKKQAGENSFALFNDCNKSMEGLNSSNKKKRKHVSESAILEAFGNEVAKTTKSDHKKKKNSSATEIAVDFESEEHSLDRSFKKKKKDKSRKSDETVVENEISVHAETILSPAKKHKKHHLASEVNETGEDPIFQMLDDLDKSRKSRMSLANSTVLPDRGLPTFDPELSQIKDGSKTPKRKRKTENSLSSDDFSIRQSPKKKKKKESSKQKDVLISSIMEQMKHNWV